MATKSDILRTAKAMGVTRKSPNPQNVKIAGLYRTAAFIAGGLANVTQLTTYTSQGLKSEYMKLQDAIQRAENYGRPFLNAHGTYAFLAQQAFRAGDKGAMAHRFAKLHQQLSDAAVSIEHDGYSVF